MANNSLPKNNGNGNQQLPTTEEMIAAAAYLREELDKMRAAAKDLEKIVKAIKGNR